MAERLKSILKRTSWSSVLKALIFALAWWVLPFWLFIPVALWLYFVPITGARMMAAPFFVLLVVSVFQSPGAVPAAIFGALFLGILLIKDLIVIDRRGGYEIIMLALSYLLVRSFFLNAGAVSGTKTLVYGVIAAWGMSAMIGSFVKTFSAAPEGASRDMRPFRRMIGWMTFLLSWQLLIVGTFLPVDFLYQSAIVFLLAAILIDIVPQYVFGELARTKLLMTGMVIFSLLVIVAASARWAL